MTEQMPDEWLDLGLPELGLPATSNVDPQKHKAETFELYSVPAFESGKPEIVRGGELASARQSVQPGDVLLCKINPRINRVWMVGAVGPYRQIASTEWVVLRPAGLDPAFFMYQMREASFRERLLDDVSGVGGSLMRARTAGIQKLRLRVAPLAEQRRIVARIEALFARTRRARTDLQRIAALSRRYSDQTLATAFDGDWPEVPVASVAMAMFDGPFGSNLKSNDYTTAGTRVVRLENIGHLHFIASKQTYVSDEKGAALARHSLRPNDVLFSSFVDKEVRVCLFPDRLQESAINKADCFCIRCDTAKCDPNFLALRLASPVTYEQMRDAVHGATRPRIGMSDLKTYRIPLPPLDVQKAIVARVQSARAAAERAEHDATRALALLDRLEQSILTRAFRGELVPQDPTDEPAADLLASVKGAGASSGNNRPRGRPRRAA